MNRAVGRGDGHREYARRPVVHLRSTAGERPLADRGARKEERAKRPAIRSHYSGHDRAGRFGQSGCLDVQLAGRRRGGVSTGKNRDKLEAANGAGNGGVGTASDRPEFARVGVASSGAATQPSSDATARDASGRFATQATSGFEASRSSNDRTRRQPAAAAIWHVRRDRTRNRCSPPCISNHALRMLDPSIAPRMSPARIPNSGRTAHGGDPAIRPSPYWRPVAASFWRLPCMPSLSRPPLCACEKVAPVPSPDCGRPLAIRVEHPADGSVLHTRQPRIRVCVSGSDEATRFDAPRHTRRRDDLARFQWSGECAEWRPSDGWVGLCKRHSWSDPPYEEEGWTAELRDGEHHFEVRVSGPLGARSSQDALQGRNQARRREPRRRIPRHVAPRVRRIIRFGQPPRGEVRIAANIDPGERSGRCAVHRQGYFDRRDLDPHRRCRRSGRDRDDTVASHGRPTQGLRLSNGRPLVHCAVSGNLGFRRSTRCL